MDNIGYTNFTINPILVLLLLTVMPDSGEFSKYDLYHIICFSQFVVVFFKLMWLGSQLSI